MDKRTSKKMHKHNPARPIWRETDIRKRLHITKDHKIRIVNLAMKLFRGGLTNQVGQLVASQSEY